MSLANSFHITMAEQQPEIPIPSISISVDQVEDNNDEDDKIRKINKLAGILFYSSIL